MRAQSYDQLEWVNDDDLLQWPVALVEGASPCGNRTVTEIGCGTGALTERLLRSVIFRDVGAYDTSPEMVRRCRERISRVDDRRVASASHVDGTSIISDADVVIGRMVLHHAPDCPEMMVRRWVTRTRPGGLTVVVDGPLPHPNERHRANDLYRQIMSVKEPDRHCFHAHEVGQMMLDAGCPEVRIAERWGPHHSVRNWLTGGGVSWMSDRTESGWRAESIRNAIRNAPTAAKDLLQVRESADGDISMRWRHCVVIGMVPA